MEVLLAAVFGALAAGGADIYVRLNEGTSERRVASRLILGDLYFFEPAFNHVLAEQRWPSHLDLSESVTVWRQDRAALAKALSAGEWGAVDNLFGLLARMNVQARPGDVTSPGDERIIQAFVGLVPEARRIVEEQAAGAAGAAGASSAATEGNPLAARGARPPSLQRSVAPSCSPGPPRQRRAGATQRKRTRALERGAMKAVGSAVE